MTPVKQTQLGKHGNCMSACLASLLDLSIDEVPNFFETCGENVDAWTTGIKEFLKERGYDFIAVSLLTVDTSYLETLDGHVIVSGQSPRGLLHATIWKNGKMVFDPHPDNTGIGRPEVLEVVYKTL